jgi:hypothetical protein
MSKQREVKILTSVSRTGGPLNNDTGGNLSDINRVNSTQNPKKQKSGFLKSDV